MNSSRLLNLLMALLVTLAFWQIPQPKKSLNTEEREVVTKQQPVKRVDEAWVRSVSRMTPEKQVEAIINKLQELNTRFDGNVTHKIEKLAKLLKLELAVVC